MPHTDDHVFGVELVDSIVYHMQRGKAAGLDNLTVEHLQFSHHLFMQCGCVPNDFSRSCTIPMLKDSKDSLSRSFIFLFIYLIIQEICNKNSYKRQ